LKYENFFKKRIKKSYNQQESMDDTWKTSSNSIHPGWLLAYRLIAFVLLLSIITTNAVNDGAGIFYFYTQWTFSLVTIYFGLGSFLSIYGCYQFWKKLVDRADAAAERVTYIALTPDENTNPHLESRTNKVADLWGYGFQILYQVCGGSVMLTDSVYWFILYPFFTADDFKLGLLMISLHSLNAIFFLGEMFLNSLEFPFYRIAYFLLWTCIYIIFQWIRSAFAPSMWWPYPFLELASPFAPLWYVGVGLLHFPCYGIVNLIFRMKQVLMSRYIPKLSLNSKHQVNIM
jgi:hypothetical protein